MGLPKGLGGRGLGQEVGPVAKHPHEIDDIPDIPVDKLPTDVMLNSEYNSQHGLPPTMALGSHIFRKASIGGNQYNLKVIAESIVINFTSSSRHDYTLPDGGFPGGMATVVCSHGDDTAPGWVLEGHVVNNQTVGFIVRQINGNWYFGLVRINYIAMGHS